MDRTQKNFGWLNTTSAVHFLASKYLKMADYAAFNSPVTPSSPMSSNASPGGNPLDPQNLASKICGVCGDKVCSA